MLHKITLTDKQHGVTYVITFNELSYIDAVAFVEEERRYTLPAIRYLIDQYVVKVEEKDRELSFEEFTTLPEHLLKTFIDALFERSQALKESSLDELVTALGERSLTLQGTYDVFLYVHLGPQLYYELLRQPLHVRAQMIVMIEKTTGIRVKERFEHAVKTGKPVDLITTGASYERQQRKGNVLRREPIKKYAGRFAPDELPTDLEEMLATSKETLDEAMRAARIGKSEKFSWTKEAAEIARYEAERDRALLEKERGKGIKSP